MIAIKINDFPFTCVSSLRPRVETEYGYDVVTLDGKRHRKFLGKKTNYDIVFYNDSVGRFNFLQQMLGGKEIVSITLQTGADTFETNDFYPEITSYQARGILEDGTMFFNGLAVTFDKVNYDE